MRKEQEKGFTLIESLISLSIFLLIVLATLEFFTFTRIHFFKLKEGQESHMAAYSALDKMKVDLFQAGAGLADPVKLELIEGIGIENNTLIINYRDKVLSSIDDIVQGQTSIRIDSSKDVKKLREICIFDDTKGEIKSISSVGQDIIILSDPLDFTYTTQNTNIVLLRKISLYLDKKTQILRRRVNSSPSQPLLEGVFSFAYEYEKTSNLVRLTLHLNTQEEKEFEILVFPKNMALASPH